MKPFNLLLIAGIVVSAAAPARAAAQQARDSAKRATSSVPVEARPPKGMCRIWIDGVPSAQQPAATDCATAVKNRPTNGRVIFGDDYADTPSTKAGEKAKLPPNMNGFSGSKPVPPPAVPKRPPE